MMGYGWGMGLAGWIFMGLFWVAIIGLVVWAVVGLLTVGTWAATRGAAGPSYPMMGGAQGAGMMDGQGAGMMGGGAMMGGGYVLPGNGRRVDSLAAARHRAQLFADDLGLRAGEVMQFSNGFYAELRTADGRGASEVLVDPAGGGVAIEYGPAMMWNTSYGMHAGEASAAAQITADDAARLAGQWLREQRRGLSVGDAEEFPGYFTLHTLRDGKIAGMMSVNAYTGAVWYHTWHGRYVAMSEE